MNTPRLVPPGIFEHALKEAKIAKTASIHSLRHSAVHLPESGTDNSYIQELLGHTFIRTTGYTYVARRKTLAITSPIILWQYGVKHCIQRVICHLSRNNNTWEHLKTSVFRCFLTL
jgi:hypothetical protein